MTELTEKEMIDFIMSAELPEDIVNYNGRIFGYSVRDKNQKVYVANWLIQNREKVLSEKLCSVFGMYVLVKVFTDPGRDEEIRLWKQRAEELSKIRGYKVSESDAYLYYEYGWH